MSEFDKQIGARVTKTSTEMLLRGLTASGFDLQVQSGKPPHVGLEQLLVVIVRGDQIERVKKLLSLADDVPKLLRP